MKLVISLATRGRPQQLLETVKKSVANWTHPDTILIVQCDADDAATLAARDYAVNTEWAPPSRVYWSLTKARPDTIAEKWNRACEQIPEASLYLVAADDDPYITPGYDTKLLEAAARFPDGIGMVYGHMANASFSGVVAPTRRLCELMGGLFPEHFPYWFVDHWTDDVARMIDRISFADVRTDQSKAGKTQEMREPGWWATWFDAAYLMRRKIARDIIMSDEFQEPMWRKDMLLAHAPLIEYRSRWINDNVRANARAYEFNSGLSLKDERYQRLRQRAVDLLPHLLDDYGMDKAEAAAFRNALTPPTLIPAIAKLYA